MGEELNNDDAGLGVVDDDTAVVDEDEILVAEEDMTPEDALAVLISAKPVKATTKIEVAAREGMGKVQLTLKALTDRQIKQIRTAALIPQTREQKRRGEEPEVDDSLYTRLIVVNGVAAPKLSDPALLRAHQAGRPEQVVDKLFLSGVVGQLFAEVMRVSGYDENAIKVLGEG